MRGIAFCLVALLATAGVTAAQNAEWTGGANDSGRDLSYGYQEGRSGMRAEVRELRRALIRLRQDAELAQPQEQRFGRSEVSLIAATEQRAIELQRALGDPARATSAYDDLVQAWARVERRRHELQPIDQPDRDMDRVTRALAALALRFPRPGMSHQDPRTTLAPSHDAHPTLVAGTRIVAEFREAICSSSMPFDSWTDTRMYLAENVRAGGKVVPQGAMLGAAVLSQPASVRGSVRSALQLQLRGVSDTHEWWTAWSHPVGFVSNGREVKVDRGAALRGPKPTGRGSEICFPAGAQVVFELSEPLVFDPAFGDR